MREIARSCDESGACLYCRALCAHRDEPGCDRGGKVAGDCAVRREIYSCSM